MNLSGRGSALLRSLSGRGGALLRSLSGRLDGGDSLAALLPGLRGLLRGPDPPLSLLPGRLRQVRGYLPILFVLLALFLALVAANKSVDSAAIGLVYMLGAVPLAFVPRRPLLAWRLAWVFGALAAIDAAANRTSAMDNSPGQVLVFLVVLFAVGATQPGIVLVWVWGLTLPVAWFGIGPDSQGFAVFWLTSFLLAGVLVRQRSQARRRLAVAEERGTVLTERARIARELHDVVAHHMSMIAVRTETAPYRLDDLPASARTEFAEIAQTSREALAEMRRVLGVLRSEEPELATVPQPGLADLPELVATARAAGAAVSVDVDATLPELPVAVGVSAYRIVQEALTNAARHAPGAPVRVLVWRTAAGVCVSVRNGSSDVAPSDTGPGHGIQGMRERAAMLNGELRVGPTSEGGFEVVVDIPVGTDE